MIQLVRSWGFGMKWFVRCPRCGREFMFSTSKLEGCADFVSVICQCRLKLGRVRSDFGGDIKLGVPEETNAYAVA